MGSSQVTQKVDKKVLIIGGSIAGFTVAEKLWDLFDVTIVDPKDYFEFNMANAKIFSDEKWIEKITMPYAEIQEANINKFKFVQGLLVQVNYDESVDIRTTVGEDLNMSYDFLILATGCSQKFPIKDSEAFSLQERIQNAQEYHTRVKSAQSILIVGGGNSGCEIAGELAATYLDKKITLCEQTNTLLQNLQPRAGQLLLDYFQRKGVNVLLKTKYEATDEQFQNYDLVIQTPGKKFQSDYLSRFFSDSTYISGEIYANDFMQLSSVDPALNSNYKALKQNIFVLGDIARLSLQNSRTYPTMRMLSDYLVKNLIQISKNKEPTSHIPDKLPYFSMICLGPQNALCCLNGMVNIDQHAAKCTIDWAEHFMSSLKGDKAHSSKMDKDFKNISGFISFMSNFCCFTQVSNRNTIVRRRH